jgi:hypothetical protein
VADHPVKAPPELVRQWIDSNIEEHTERLLVHNVANRAAQWGADQELEACCREVDCAGWVPSAGSHLRAIRRPKPPTLAEQGMEALSRCLLFSSDESRALRAALNRLAELEAQQ